MKALDLVDGSKGVNTPHVKEKDEEVVAGSQEEALDAAHNSTFRSIVMRASYLAQDRADIGDAVKCLSRCMANPNNSHWRQLKRLGRFLQAKPRVVSRYRTQPNRLTHVNVEVDSDHAGCILTRRSTTGCVTKVGTHVIAHSSKLQSTVSLSSGESEYYALVKGADGSGTP